MSVGFSRHLPGSGGIASMSFWRSQRPIVCGVVLLAGLIAWPVVASAGSDPDCTADPNLRIKIGDALLSVPRRYAPNIFVPKGKYVGHAKDICQRPDDPAIESRGITIRPGTDRLIELEPDSITEPVWHVQIRIRKHLARFRTPEKAYEDVVDLIESNGRRLTALPQKHGFFADDSASRGPHYYIAPQETTAWLDPAPLVIECSSVELSTPGGRGIYYGRDCGTNVYYRFSDTLAVRYKFYDGRHPVETWTELDVSVHAFVQSLVKDGT